MEGGGIGGEMEEGGTKRDRKLWVFFFCYVTSIQTKYFLLEITNILIRLYMF